MGIRSTYQYRQRKTQFLSTPLKNLSHNNTLNNLMCFKHKEILEFEQTLVIEENYSRSPIFSKHAWKSRSSSVAAIESGHEDTIYSHLMMLNLKSTKWLVSQMYSKQALFLFTHGHLTPYDEFGNLSFYRVSFWNVILSRVRISLWVNLLNYHLWSPECWHNRFGNSRSSKEINLGCRIHWNY